MGSRLSTEQQTKPSDHSGEMLGETRLALIVLFVLELLLTVEMRAWDLQMTLSWQHRNWGSGRKLLWKLVRTTLYQAVPGFPL